MEEVYESAKSFLESLSVDVNDYVLKVCAATALYRELGNAEVTAVYTAGDYLSIMSDRSVRTISEGDTTLTFENSVSLGEYLRKRALGDSAGFRRLKW